MLPSKPLQSKEAYDLAREAREELARYGKAEYFTTPALRGRLPEDLHLAMEFVHQELLKINEIIGTPGLDYPAEPTEDVLGRISPEIAYRIEVVHMTVMHTAPACFAHFGVDRSEDHRLYPQEMEAA